MYTGTYFNMDKIFCLLLLFEVRTIIGTFNFSNILDSEYDPAILPAGSVNVKVFFFIFFTWPIGYHNNIT